MSLCRIPYLCIVENLIERNKCERRKKIEPNLFSLKKKQSEIASHHN